MLLRSTEAVHVSRLIHCWSKSHSTTQTPDGRGSSPALEPRHVAQEIFQVGLVNFHHTKRRARPSPREAWRSPQSARRFFRWDLVGFSSAACPNPTPVGPRAVGIRPRCPKGVRLGRVVLALTSCPGWRPTPGHATTCPDTPPRLPDAAGRPHAPSTPTSSGRTVRGPQDVSRVRLRPECPGCAPVCSESTGSPQVPTVRPERPAPPGNRRDAHCAHGRTTAQAHARSGTGAPEAHVCPPRPEPKPRMPAGAQDRPTEGGFHPSPHGAVPGTARPGCPEVPGHGMPALPCPGRGTVPQVPMGRPRTRCRGPAGRDASRAPCRAVARAAARVPQRRIAPSSGIPRRIRVPPPHLVSHECPGPCGTSG